MTSPARRRSERDRLPARAATRPGLRLFALAAVSLLLAAILLRAGDPPRRDWRACPAVVTLDTTDDIYALGDVHGDYSRLVKLLIAGKLIAGSPEWPKDVQWTGGDAVLVCTGDLIDKWYHGVDVIELLRALAKSASKHGGRVIVTAGNHEAEFLDDPYNSKAEDFRQELQDQAILPEDVAVGRDSLGLGKYLLCLPFASRVNDWFFSHAGNTGGLTIEHLRKKVQHGVDEDGYGTDILLGDKGLLEARLKPPWWEEDGDDPEASVARLRGYADALGVRHIVFGHQPGNYDFNDGSHRERGTMFQNFDGLVFLIDVGMSRGVGDSTGSLLRIRRHGDSQTATALYRDDPPRQLWPAEDHDRGMAGPHWISAHAYPPARSLPATGSTVSANDGAPR
jgi:Calcineurin-like phosphoesterase